MKRVALWALAITVAIAMLSGADAAANAWQSLIGGTQAFVAEMQTNENGPPYTGDITE